MGESSNKTEEKAFSEGSGSAESSASGESDDESSELREGELSKRSQIQQESKTEGKLMLKVFNSK